MRDDDHDHVHETKGWEAARSAVRLHEQSWALDELLTRELGVLRRTQRKLRAHGLGGER